MFEQYSIAEASDNFAQVVHTVEQGKSVEITRQGKAVASFNTFFYITRI